jgi:hypothetical protein
MKLSFLTTRRAVIYALTIALLGAGAVNRAFAQPKGMPPIIDRELFFGDPEIVARKSHPTASTSLSSNLSRHAQHLGQTHRRSVRQGEADYRRHQAANPAYFWSRDGKYVMFVQDKGGDENFLVYAVDPSATPAAGQEVPAARNLTDAKGVNAQIYALPRTDPDAIYVGLNDRDQAWHDLYKVKISTGRADPRAQEH